MPARYPDAPPFAGNRSDGGSLTDLYPAKAPVEHESEGDHARIW